MKLHEKLTSLRKEQRLTQLKVAEELHVSRQAVSRWEAGISLPSSDNLKCLGKLYGVPLDLLLDDSKEIETLRSTEAGRERETNGGAEFAAADQSVKEKGDAKHRRKKDIHILVVVIAATIAILTAILCGYMIRGQDKRGKRFEIDGMHGEPVEKKDENVFALEW